MLIVAALAIGVGVSVAALGSVFSMLLVGIGALFVGGVILYYHEFAGLLLLALIYPMLEVELRGLPLAKIYALGLLALLVARFAWREIHGRPGPGLDLPVLVPFALLTAAGFASSINSLAPATTIFRVLLQIAIMYVVVVVAYNMITTWAQLRWTLGVMVGISTISALIGWLNYAQGRFQAVSAFYRRVTPPEYLGGTHVALAELLVVAAPLALALALTVRRTWLRALLLLIVGLFAVTTFFTLSRAGWICMALQVPLWVWAFRRQPVVLVGSLVGALGAGALAAGPMIALLNSYLPESSDQVRDFLAELAVQLFMQHPLIGVGFGTFASYNYMVYDRSFDPPLALDAHGMIYKIGAETGLFGLGAAALLLGMIFWRLYLGLRAACHAPRWRPIMYGCIIALFISTVFELSSTRFYSIQYWFPVAVCLAAARLARRDAAQPLAAEPQE